MSEWIAWYFVFFFFVVHGFGLAIGILGSVIR